MKHKHKLCLNPRPESINISPKCGTFHVHLLRVEKTLNPRINLLEYSLRRSRLVTSNTLFSPPLSFSKPNPSVSPVPGLRLLTSFFFLQIYGPGDLTLLISSFAGHLESSYNMLMRYSPDE